MRNISIDDINAAILNGGAGSLLVRVELEPASGLDGIIAPAKYAGANNATYVYEKRYLGEEKPQKVVLIDSKGSFANRVEETITEARRTGEGLLASMPHIVVKYDDESGSKTYCDSQLPHRGFDGHIRVGVHDGKPTSEAKEYSSSGTNVSCEGGVMSSDPWLNLCWHVKPKRNFVNCRNIADS